MSLDKAIEHNKEKRKPYRGAKSCASSCRNHGSCDYCKNARLFARRKSEERCVLAEKEYFEELYIFNQFRDELNDLLI